MADSPHPDDAKARVAGGVSWCPQCGADLGDLRLGRCAGCGQAIDASAGRRFRAREHGRVRMEAPGVMDFEEPIRPEWDLHCTNCDYSLTGLTSRTCPECGQNFRPRQTWLVNRKAEREEDQIVRPWLLKTGCAACLGIVMALLLYRFWPLVLLVWGILEVIAWTRDLDAYGLRVLLGSYLALSLILMFVW